jgi:hypothetical protein
MVLTCSNCKHTWEVSAGHILGARLKFGLGFEEHAFTCPNCNTKNVVTKAQFEATNQSQAQTPVTGIPTQTEADIAHPPRASNTGGRAPTNPVPGPDLSSRQYHGVVLERGLEIRREHNNLAEIMGPLGKGEKLTILDTWTDGEDTWALLGPERWVIIERNGEALIELTDE